MQRKRGSGDTRSPSLSVMKGLHQEGEGEDLGHAGSVWVIRRDALRQLRLAPSLERVLGRRGARESQTRERPCRPSTPSTWLLFYSWAARVCCSKNKTLWRVGEHVHMQLPFFPQSQINTHSLLTFRGSKPVGFWVWLRRWSLGFVFYRPGRM